MQFIVTACFDAPLTIPTRHATINRIVVATTSLNIAIDTARDVEKHKYQFQLCDTGVVVSAITPDKIYSNPTKSGDQAIFVRRKTSGGWVEEWLNKELKEEFEKSERKSVIRSDGHVDDTHQ